MDWSYFMSLEAIGEVRDFLESGGSILWLLMGLAFLFWVSAYYCGVWLRYEFPRANARALHHWQAHYAYQGMGARKYHNWIRQKILSEIWARPRFILAMMKMLVRLAPLLGLLGTTTGMMAVFEIMAITGSGQARALADGIARAVLPTMAGMVVALTGLFFINIIERRLRRAYDAIAVHLRLEA